MVVHIYSNIVSLLMLTRSIELFQSGQERHTIFTLFFLSEGTCNVNQRVSGTGEWLGVRYEPLKILKARVVSHPL